MSLTNIDLSKKLVDCLLQQGVDTYVVCGGSRSTPLIAVLQSYTNIVLFNHFEERSAGFFALGIAKRIRKPVGVVVTSGTAAAELLPSCIEGYYSAIPLVLITADRPRSYRGTGAPQTIEQKDLLSPYAPCFDIENPEQISTVLLLATAPTQINVCFDEPILGVEVTKCTSFASTSNERKDLPYKDSDVDSIVSFLKGGVRPLLILGELRAIDREAVRQFCLHAQIPIFAEALSGLREERSLKGLLITSGEKMLPTFDRILRIGGIPVCTFWRTLAHTPGKTLSVDRKHFSGIPAGKIITTDIALICERLTREVESYPRWDGLEENVAQTQKLQDLLNNYPHSEPALISRLSQIIDPEDFVYLGNSLPIREWDLVSSRAKPHSKISASRGANGIDGQISSFIGEAHEKHRNWCIVGDLTALYDTAGFWSVKSRFNCNLQFCVINNQGGQIFERLPAKRHFDEDSYDVLIKNAHHLTFQPVAKLWGLSYQLISEPETIDTTHSSLIEIRPDPGQTREFWERYDAL